MPNKQCLPASEKAALTAFPTFIPYGKQFIQQEDIDAVTQCLQQPLITQGPVVTEFEREISRNTQSHFACALNSGTAALHVACLALGLGENDWLWTTPISFIASANCALYCQAKVDFVDIDASTRNMCVEALEEKLILAKKMNRLPKVIVVVHFSGLSADMEKIWALSQEYAFNIIEDACHALGGEYKHKKIGCCEWSHICTFSFHPVKSITTGEGGMLCTNNESIFLSAKRLTQQGITRDPSEMELPTPGPWYYEQSLLGFNYRLTDIQASLGIRQLKHLNDFVKIRNQLASKYTENLTSLPLRLPKSNTPDANLNAFHIYVIEVTADANLSRAELYQQLSALNIGVNVHYIPIHLQPFYRRLGFKEGDFPNAELYYKNCITIPLYVQLTTAEQDFVIKALAHQLR